MNETELNIDRSPLLMSRDDTALIIIDVQEKLVPHVLDSTKLVWNITRLVEGAQWLGLPIRLTEQYPKGLGPTVAEIKNYVDSAAEKVLFSCRECRDVFEELANSSVQKILLTGMETHVCVMQTALDMIARGFDVYLAVDAVSSRFDIDHQTALKRMESAGVTLVTTEMALFEWCESSQSPEFKSISKLIQQSPPKL